MGNHRLDISLEKSGKCEVTIEDHIKRQIAFKLESLRIFYN